MLNVVSAKGNENPTIWADHIGQHVRGYVAAGIDMATVEWYPALRPPAWRPYMW